MVSQDWFHCIEYTRFVALIHGIGSLKGQVLKAGVLKMVFQDRWSLVAGSINLKCIVPAISGLSRQWSLNRCSRQVSLY